MEFLTGLFEYAFLQKALFTSVMVGIICGVIGCFIILRGMACDGRRHIACCAARCRHLLYAGN